MVVKIQIVIFWAKTSLGLVRGYQRFGGTFFLLLQCKLMMETADHSESWQLLTRLRGAKNQKTTI
jgi:hypothetical protein